MDMTQDIYEHLLDYIERNKGNCKLQFCIRDIENEFKLQLVSKSHQIAVEQELIDYIKSVPNIDYKLN